jgi:hypothetical protein
VLFGSYRLACLGPQEGKPVRIVLDVLVHADSGAGVSGLNGTQ